MGVLISVLVFIGVTIMVFALIYGVSKWYVHHYDNEVSDFLKLVVVGDDTKD